jgi:DUF4097 and DUF4098 domain-containing protein YvlB
MTAMKNSAIVRIVIWSAVIVLLIVAAVMMWGGSGWSFGGINMGSGYRYSDPSSYLIGDFSANADTVSSMDIDWIAGSVTISEYDGNDIKVTEDGFEDEDTTMRYRIKDGKLAIRFCKSGLRFGNFFGIGNKTHEKDLTILVPKGKQFRKLDLELVSSRLDVENITATEFDVEIVSGSVNIDNLTADDIDIEGVSGAITLENISAGTVDIDNISGAIEFAGKVDEIDFSTVSGGITAEFDQVPRAVNIDSVSGSATIRMPETGITANIDSVSASIRAFGAKFAKSGETTLGDGYMTLNVDTVSGSVEIKEK